MRILMLARAAVLAYAALPALAQDQAPGQVPVQPQVQELPKDQAPPPLPDQGQSQELPKILPKSQDRVQVQSAPAETGAPPKTLRRYTFDRVNDGFLRLDNETGQIAFCGPHSMGWACEAVPEDRAALEKEIARLQDEVVSLKTQIAALRAPPPRPPETAPPTPHAGKDGDAEIKLPSREDLARARDFFESAWRRLEEMIVNIQKDMMHKS